MLLQGSGYRSCVETFIAPELMQLIGLRLREFKVFIRQYFTQIKRYAFYSAAGVIQADRNITVCKGAPDNIYAVYFFLAFFAGLPNSS